MVERVNETRGHNGHATRSLGFGRVRSGVRMTASMDFDRTGANWCERCAHLLCRRSWVRVPSSASQKPRSAGFSFPRQAPRTGPASETASGRRLTFDKGPPTQLTAGVRTLPQSSERERRGPRSGRSRCRASRRVATEVVAHRPERDARARVPGLDPNDKWLGIPDHVSSRCVRPSQPRSIGPLPDISP